MKIFYYCSTGTYTSLVAANYHLGVISGPELNYRKLFNLPNFNCLTRDEIGQPISVGIDANGNEIFTFGVKEENILLTKAMIDWLEVFNISKKEYKLVDLTGIKGNYMHRTGIYLSINMGIRNFGGLIGAYGLSGMLQSIYHIVDRVKGELT